MNNITTYDLPLRFIEVCLRRASLSCATLPVVPPASPASCFLLQEKETRNFFDRIAQPCYNSLMSANNVDADAHNPKTTHSFHTDSG